MSLMVQTRQTLIQGFALDALFRKKKLVVSDADIDDVCSLMNPQNPQAVRRELQDNGRNFVLREMVERYCANKWLVEHANITYTEPEEAAAENTAAEDGADA